MSRVAHVWPEPARDVEDPDGGGPMVEVAATVEWPRRLRDLLQGLKVWRARRQRLWIRLPAGTDVPPAAVGDAALLATLFGAMRRAEVAARPRRGDRGAAPERGAAREVWHGRRPDKYARAAARGRPHDRRPSRPPGPAVLTFSGGLDSAYSLHRHTAPHRPADVGAVGTAMMVAGADIPVDEREAFSRASSGPAA